MDDLEGDGYALADMVLAAAQCEHIAASLPPVLGAGRGGVRNLITHPTVVRLLLHERFGKYLWSVIGRDLVAVKATLFDKTPAANWRVQWHQDRAVAVKERLNIAGYGPWSTKAGCPHVEPPAEVLAQMLAVRVHLDECGAENGPVRVIPGSHRSGKLSEAEIARLVAGSAATELYVPRGAMLLMRPLLVHSSSPAVAPEHRRVLHIELAPAEAISPLQWQTALPLRRAA
ncbi:MAG TPA: phytanoyl-CoA dioxygenase family protein [Thermoanaerobaculia bacterium]|nr:phytanoyl-CoA dioxygenase family protein [Thermoanaerobaculia bacterium]